MVLIRSKIKFPRFYYTEHTHIWMNKIKPELQLKRKNIELINFWYYFDNYSMDYDNGNAIIVGKNKFKIINTIKYFQAMGLINENINIENCFIKKREYNEKYNFTKSNNCKAKIIGMKTDEDIKQCQSDITTMDNINIIKLFTYKTEDNNWLIELIFDSQKNCNKFIGKWILNNKKNPA